MQTIPSIGFKNTCLDVITTAHTRLIIKILDVHGRFVATLQQTLEQGAHQCELNLESLSDGHYVMNAFNGDKFISSFHYIKSV